MSGFDNFNTHITPLTPPIGGVISSPPTEKKQETPQETAETKNKKSYAKTMKGATIVAGIAVAGVAIAKRGVITKYLQNLVKNAHDGNINFSNNVRETFEDVKPKIFDVAKRNYELSLNERLKDRINAQFQKITDNVFDSPERQRERLQALLTPQDKIMPFDDKRLFVSHEAEMVSSYLDEYAFNIPLRLGKIKPEKSIEIRTLDEMIEQALPLKEKATVYRGIVTQKDGNVLDFAQNIRVGNILEDKAFISTSRNAAETIANYGEQNCYVMRITLPENTKGIDCRRFTMLDLDKGANAVFILPRNSKLRINAIDDRTKIIDAQYLLQN